MSSEDAGSSRVDRSMVTVARGSRRVTLAKIAFGAAVLAFGVVFVASRWSRVRAALADTSPGWLVLALVAAAIGQWASMLGFRSALSATSRRLPVGDAARMFFLSQLGKYLPGSIWPLLAVTEMGRRYGVARREAAVAGVLALLFSLVVGTLVGILFLLAGLAGAWWLLLFLPPTVALAHPRVIGFGVERALRLARREPVELHLHGATLLGVLGWPVISWVFLGLQCWALVVALGGPVLGSLTASVGGFALAYTAGTLFVPAPAGAGVREAVLGFALVGVIAQSSLGHDKVLVIVLLSRVLLALLDFAQAGLAVALNRRTPNPV